MKIDVKDMLYVFATLTIAFLATQVRLLNIDKLNNELLSMDDPYLFLRYSNEIYYNGSLPPNDTLRYYPDGITTEYEMTLPSKVATLLAKAIKLFNNEEMHKRILLIKYPFQTEVYDGVKIESYNNGKVYLSYNNESYINGIEKDKLKVKFLGNNDYGLKFEVIDYNRDNPIRGYYYYPAFCVFIGAIFVSLLGKEIFNSRIFGIILLSIFILSRAILFRTATGFLEKEPLSIIFLPASFYFFVKFIKEKEVKRELIYAIAYSISTFLFANSWGGWAYVIYSVSIFYVIYSILKGVSLRKNLIYALTIALIFIPLPFTVKKYKNFYETYQFQLQVISLIFGLFSLLKEENFKFLRIKFRRRRDFVLFKYSLLVALILIGGSIYYGGRIVTKLSYLSNMLTHPLRGTRMGESIVENQPIFFINNYLPTFPIEFPLFYISVILLLFYSVTLRNKNLNLILAITLFLFFTFIIVKKYSSSNDIKISQILNSIPDEVMVTLVSVFAIIVIVIAAFSLYAGGIRKVNTIYLLIASYVIPSAMVASGAARLLFTAALPISLGVTFFMYLLYKSKNFVNPYLFALPYLFLLIFSFSFSNLIIPTLASACLAIIHYARKKGRGLNDILLFASILIAGAIFVSNFLYYHKVFSNLGNSFDTFAWNDAMNFLKEKEGAVIHWWDYGYFIQYKAHLPTVGDPGNYFVVRNYDVGRYLMGGEFKKLGEYEEFKNETNESLLNKTDIEYILEKYGKPKYLLICSEDIGKFYQMERIGMKDVYIGTFSYLPLSVQTYKTYKDIKSYIVGKYPFLENFSIMLFKGASQLGQDFIRGEGYESEVFSKDTSYITLIAYLYEENESYAFANLINAKTGKQLFLPLNGTCYKKIGCLNSNLTDKLPGYFYVSPESIELSNLTNSNAIVGFYIMQREKDMLLPRLYLLEEEVPGFKEIYNNKQYSFGIHAYSLYGGREDIRIYEINYTQLSDVK